LPVDQVEPRLAFVESSLEISNGNGAEIDRAPLDVEDSVWSAAADRCKDTATCAIGAKIVPVRQDRHIEGAGRQAYVAEGVAVADEL
jgi:hypothetical protein